MNTYTKNCFALIVITVLSSLTAIGGHAAEMKSTPKKVLVDQARSETALKKARKVAEELSSSQKITLLSLLNRGSEKDLGAIKGIASGRAKAVIKERPFTTVEDVIKVRGIGLSTFASIIDHGKNPPILKKAVKS